MKTLKSSIVPILLSTLWISLSEFVRNEFILKDYWTNHYKSLGLVFPAEPINGVIWGVWSLCFALLIFILYRKFSFIETSALSWFSGFVLMWLVVGNMMVLPFKILTFAVPLSMIEVIGTVAIYKQFKTKQRK